MISVNPDDWKLLFAAEQAYGMITMLLARAVLLDVSDQMIRRRLERLEAKKLLASGWVMPLPEHGTTPIKVWYTLHKAATGGDSGIARIRAAVRAQMAKPEDKRRKLKYGETLITPDTLFHDQICAALTIGFGRCGTRFDSSFDRNEWIPGVLKIPDGKATLENGIQLLFEAERMERKTEHEWRRDQLTGLPCSIHSAGQAEGYKYEHVIIVPRRLFDGLYRVVSRCKRERERGGAKGYWCLPWEEPTADLEWVSLRGDVREPMAGLARMRAESPVRAKNARLLRERRELKARGATKGQSTCPSSRSKESRFFEIEPQATVSATALSEQRLPEPGSRKAKAALQKLIDDMRQHPVAVAPKIQMPAYAPGSARNT